MFSSQHYGAGEAREAHNLEVSRSKRDGANFFCLFFLTHFKFFCCILLLFASFHFGTRHAPASQNLNKVTSTRSFSTTRTGTFTS